MQQQLFSNDLEALRAELLQLANVEFPAVAAVGKHPVDANHCFLRIIYDNVLGKPWSKALQPNRPAYLQLTRKQLVAALALARSMIKDPVYCQELNRRSLAWRRLA